MSTSYFTHKVIGDEKYDNETYNHLFQIIGKDEDGDGDDIDMNLRR